MQKVQHHRLTGLSKAKIKEQSVMTSVTVIFIFKKYLCKYFVTYLIFSR